MQDQKGQCRMPSMQSGMITDGHKHSKQHNAGVTDSSNVPHKSPLLRLTQTTGVLYGTRKESVVAKYCAWLNSTTSRALTYIATGQPSESKWRSAAGSSTGHGRYVGPRHNAHKQPLAKLLPMHIILVAAMGPSLRNMCRPT